MTPDQIPELIAKIALADPRVQRQDKLERRAQVDMWAGILADVPQDFALQAAYEHYRNSQWPIMPADIATRWTTIAKDRLDRHTDPIPPVDPDNVDAWCEELAATRQAVALGHVKPAPQAIAAGPPAAVAELLAGVGRTMPKRDAQKSYIPEYLKADFAAVLPQRAAREAARERGGVDLLAVTCPWCQAPVGQQCKRRTNSRDRTSWHRRNEPHPTRVDAVVIALACCPACQVTPGVPCRTEDNQLHPGVHPQRIASALDGMDPTIPAAPSA